MYHPFDELDYQILEKLKENARVPAVEIARELDESERKIRKRIDRMVDLGIGQFTVVVDPVVFGYGITVDIFLEVEPAWEESVTEALLQMSELTFIANDQEGKGFSIEARFKTLEKMYTFLRNTLPAVDGVKIREYALVPRVLRDVDSWIPPREDFGSRKN